MNLNYFLRRRSSRWNCAKMKVPVQQRPRVFRVWAQRLNRRRNNFEMTSINLEKDETTMLIVRMEWDKCSWLRKHNKYLFAIHRCRPESKQFRFDKENMQSDDKMRIAENGEKGRKDEDRNRIYNIVMEMHANVWMTLFVPRSCCALKNILLEYSTFQARIATATACLPRRLFFILFSSFRLFEYITHK